MSPLPPIFDIDLSRLREDEEVIVMPDGGIWIVVKPPELPRAKWPKAVVGLAASLLWIGIGVILWFVRVK